MPSNHLTLLSVAGKLNDGNAAAEDSSVNNSAGGSSDTKKGKAKNAPKRRDSMSSVAIGEQKQPDSAERQLIYRFQLADDAEVNIKHLLQHWNRRELRMIRPFPGDVNDEVKPDKEKDKKGGKNKKNEEEEARKEEEARRELEEELAREWVGVELYEHQFEEEPTLDKIDNFLPEQMEILEGLGLGPNGPPIPEPTMFSVVPMPSLRAPPMADSKKHFEFIATGPDDPNVDQNDNDDLANADQDSLADNEPKKETVKETKRNQKKADKGMGLKKTFINLKCLN